MYNVIAMTIDRLKRVMWRLKEILPDAKEYSYQELRKAVMEECGTDERTIADAIKKLIELKMLTSGGFGYLKVGVDYVY